MNETFKYLIKAAMKEKGITINKAAQEALISRDILYRYLGGQTKSMNSIALGKLFEYLGLEVK